MYTIVFRKGKFELTFSTDDKDAVSRQMELVIRQSSDYALAHKQNVDNNDVADNVSNAESIQEEKPQEQEYVNEYKTEPVSLRKETDSEPILNENENEQVAQPEVHDFVPPQVERPAIDAPDVVPTNLDIATTKSVTINSLQNPAPPIQEEAPNFDEILNNEMSQPVVENQNLKDKKFIDYVESKSVIEKVDFLVAAAQYLAHYEGMNTFNLKHINAKLMQNFTIIVDHSVLQSAISRGDITKIQQGNDDGSSEYMLTEKGLRSI